MSYEEDRHGCPRCGRETWHGRDVPDPPRPWWLAAYASLLTLASDRAVPWRCLECGERRRGRRALVKDRAADGARAEPESRRPTG